MPTSRRVWSLNRAAQAYSVDSCTAHMSPSETERYLARHGHGTIFIAQHHEEGRLAMKHIKIGTLDVSRIGLGAMSMSGYYNTGAGSDAGGSRSGGVADGTCVRPEVGGPAVESRAGSYASVPDQTS